MSELDDKVTLPSGGWVQVRDPKSFRAGDKKRIMRGMRGTPEEIGAGEVGVYLTEGIVRAMILAWEIPYLPNAPIPSVEPDITDELEIPDYDRILDAANEVRKVVFPGPVTPDDYDKPESPTQPAGA